MRLLNARLWNEPGNCDILVSGSTVTAVQNAGTERGRFNAAIEVELEDALVLPGFINSHDHLDFNCFPALANGIYPDYRVWGADIHRHYADRIRAVKNIPQELRIRWGLYKNLLNGFTTVVNHGDKLSIDDSLVSVIQENHILHSPGFEKNWKWKLNNPFRRGRPFVIHAGEGTSDAAITEIRELVKANLLKREIIIVHGVAMKASLAGHFKGLVWCPASNYFLLGETADINGIRERIPVVFGTDSTLSACWDAWRHFHVGQNQPGLTDEGLLQMLTRLPAALWGLDDRGGILSGKRADLLVLDPGTALFEGDATGIRMVIEGGVISVLDDAMIPAVKGFSKKGYSKIMLHGRIKWVLGDLPGLCRSIRSFYPELEIPFQY